MLTWKRVNIQPSLSMRTKCQDSSNPYRNGEKAETKCVPKTGCAKEDEMRGRMKKLLKERNRSIYNSRKQLQSKGAWHCLECPQQQHSPRSCWAASLPAPCGASTPGHGAAPGTAQAGPRAPRDLRECWGCAWRMHRTLTAVTTGGVATHPAHGQGRLQTLSL